MINIYDVKPEELEKFKKEYESKILKFGFYLTRGPTSVGKGLAEMTFIKKDGKNEIEINIYRVISEDKYKDFADIFFHNTKYKNYRDLSIDNLFEMLKDIED